MIPERFRERYCPLVDDEPAFLEALGRQLPKSFRVNRLKAAPEDITMRFDNYGIRLAGVPWYSDAFICESLEAGFTLEHFSGAIYMQELVSMLPPLILHKELESASFALDACAAPGSKTTQMAAIMGNRGTLVANDISFSRIRALKFNLEKAGALNCVITNRDLNAFANLGFQVVVLDAPCSSEGTIRKNPDVFDTWSERGIANYSKVQKQLILKAFDMLAPGGAMVYSTCTFAPEENEAVLDWLLQNRPEAHVDPVCLEGLRSAPGIGSWEGQEFHQDVRKAARIWPHHNDTGGFFLARVAK